MAEKNEVRPGSNADLDDFTAGGERRDSGDMWPHSKSELGDSLLGRLDGIKTVQGDKDTYEVATFSPVVVKTSRGKSGFLAASVAVSATLRGRIGARDVGTVFALVFKGVQPGKRYKLFDVFEQTPEKLIAVLQDTGAPEEIVKLAGLPF